MNNLKLKYVSAKNFLCFGETGVEVNFSKLGNIVLIRGENMDIHASSEEERVASNGTGKSSIPEIIVYGLFGKTIKNTKKLDHKDVINNKTKKKLEIIVEIDNLRIVRTRKPDSLRVWESADGIWSDETEKTKGGMPATQEYIESKIGFSFETFLNVVVFTDNNVGCFLECDGPTKRKVVENILALARYRGYSEISRAKYNELDKKVKEAARVLETTIAEFENSKRRIVSIEQQEKEWKQNKEKEITGLSNRYKEKQTELKSTDTGAAIAAWETAQEKIAANQEKIPELEAELEKYKDMLQKASTKIQELVSEVDVRRKTVSEYEQSLSSCNNSIRIETTLINDAEARRCKFCNQTDENIIVEAQKKLEELTINKSKFEELFAAEKVEYEKVKTNHKKFSDAAIGVETKRASISADLDKLRREISSLMKIEKPEASSNEQILKEQLNELGRQILAKKAESDGASPFAKIYAEAVEDSKKRGDDCDQKKADLSEGSKKLPYYQFWVTAFGETGIRKFIIDGIIPALNSRIAHWLQYLIDGKIKLTFNDELDETIERNPKDGDPFVYYAMSGGERRRLNLAVSQSFAYVMMLNAGVCPSVVFLDEVTTNVDPIGVQGIYNMILELSKERQVFVTTHDHDLLSLLNGCESINLKKQNGFTSLV